MHLKQNWRWFVSVVIIVAAAGLAFSRRSELASVIVTVQSAHPVWLVGAILLQACVYVMFSLVMRQSLIILNYRLPVSSILPISFTGIALNRFFPSSGTLTEIVGLGHRDIPRGTATVALSLNLLSGFSAFGVLLFTGFGYLVTHGGIGIGNLLALLPVLFIILLLAGFVFRQARDRERLTRRALAIQEKIGRLARRSFAPDAILHFLDEAYEGVTLIRTNIKGFIQLVGMQLVTLLLDGAGLMLLFIALDVHPNLLMVILGYALAYTVATVSSLPGGGGSFEAAMTLTYTRLGVASHVALSVTLLYRFMTFWLPLMVVAIAANRLRAKQPQIPAS